MTTHPDVIERLNARNRDLVRAATKAAGISGGSYRSKSENIDLLIQANVVDITDDGEPVFNMQVVHDAARGAREAREAREVLAEDYDWPEGAVDDPSVDLPEAPKSITHKITIDQNGHSLLTLVVDGEMTQIRDSAVNYTRVVTALLAGEDPTPFLTDDLDSLLTWVNSIVSDRITISHTRDDKGEAHAKVLIDGEEVHGKVVDQFKRYWLEGRDPTNIIRFLERVKDNPLPVAEVGLYDWGSALTIDTDGYFIGFKSVRPVGTDEEGNQVFEPGRTGPGYVNGVRPENGYLRQKVGDVVTIDRELVRPGPECSVGLHVGTWDYARTFYSGGVVMEVRVNPADIVNVPRYQNGKLRCVKYQVLGFHDANGVLDHLEPEATWDEESAVELIEETVDEETRGWLRRIFNRRRG